MTDRTLRAPRFLPLFGLLAGLGVLGNVASLPILFGVDFLFGSIATMLAVQWLPPVWGIAVGAIASSYTYALWDHPYAIVIFTAEAAFVAWQIRRGRRNIAIADGIFWLCLGLWLVGAFYGGALRLSFETVANIALKQACNGLFNALIASLLVQILPLILRLGRTRAQRLVSLEQGTINFSIAFAFLPILALTIFSGGEAFRDTEANILSRLAAEGISLEREINSWFADRQQSISDLAVAIETGAGAPPQSLLQFSRPARIFQTLQIVNERTGEVTEQSAGAERPESRSPCPIPDRFAFVDSSGAANGAANGAADDAAEPYFAFAEPISGDRWVCGTVSRQELAQKLQEHTAAWGIEAFVRDDRGRAIANSFPDSDVTLSFDPAAEDTLRHLERGQGFLWMPPRDGRPRLRRWRQSYYGQTFSLDGLLPGQLLLRLSPGPYIDALQARYARYLAMVLAIWGIALFLAGRFSQRLVAPLRYLTDVANSLPQRIYGDRGLPTAPASRIAEIDLLSRTIWRIGVMLERQFDEVQAINAELDARVRERTAALQESEERWQLAIEGNNEGIWDRNLAADETFLSPRYLELFGYAAAELDTFAKWQQVIHPEDRDRVWENFQRHLRGETERYTCEYRVRQKDGSYRWLNAQGKAIWNADGEPVRAVGSVADISDRKAAEAALKESEARFRQAVDGAPYPIMIHAEEGEVLQINRAWTQITGYTHTDIPTVRAWAQLAYGARANRVLEEIIAKKYALTSPWHEGEFAVRIRDGTERIWDFSSAPLGPLPDGRRSIISVAADVTERKQNVRALRHATREAEAAVRAKSLFLASMSHEIRTPMNGVMGMLDLLLQTDLDAEQESWARVAQSSAESLLTLIDDILDFSKVDAGKLDLEILDFDLLQMTGDLVRDIALRAEQKRLELVLDTSGIDRASVKGDPGRLRQIFTNLIGNAIKFTTQGEIVIRCQLRPGADDNSLTLLATVSDSGIGISEEKLATLFSPFAQVDTSTTRKYGGTGLGLSIVKKLCELMGGDICARSEPGKGSQFEFKVTLQTSEAPERPPIDLHEATVLIVDDNTASREALRQQLAGWGARVVAIADGREALAECTIRASECRDASKPPFDFALIDWQMPGMSGLDLCEHLRADPRFAAMPLGILTPISYQENARWLAELDISYRLTKPVTAVCLREALSALHDVSPPVEAETPDAPKTPSPEDRLQPQTSPTEAIASFTWPEGTRLLLVEDNAVNRTVFKGITRNLGLIVDAVGNGLEALSALETAPEDRPYALIFMDCQMPEMDGYEASRLIRQGRAGDRYRDIPIVALTASAMEGDRERCIEAGMTDYLTKPIRPDALLAAIQKWLQ